MKCTICKREARISKNPRTGNMRSETFIGFEHNLKCPECYEKINGVPPLGLKDIEIIRRRNITQEQYYKEKGYK